MVRPFTSVFNPGKPLFSKPLEPRTNELAAKEQGRIGEGQCPNRHPSCSAYVWSGLIRPLHIREQPMATLKKPFTAAGLAVTYITTGALLIVWGVVWWVYLQRTGVEHSALYYVCAGINLSGATLLVIGLGLGRIGRSAQKAELPPEPVNAPVVIHQVTEPR